MRGDFVIMVAQNFGDIDESSFENVIYNFQSNQYCIKLIIVTFVGYYSNIYGKDKIIGPLFMTAVRTISV